MNIEIEKEDICIYTFKKSSLPSHTNQYEWFKITEKTHKYTIICYFVFIREETSFFFVYLNKLLFNWFLLYFYLFFIIFIILYI